MPCPTPGTRRLAVRAGDHPEDADGPADSPRPARDPSRTRAGGGRLLRGVLGFTRIGKPENLRHLGGLWFACEGSDVQLHLGVEDDFRPARKAHPAFVVRDLPTMEDALSAAGRPVVVDTQLGGYRRFYTEDPFGNRIEILSEERSTSGS